MVLTLAEGIAQALKQAGIPAGELRELTLDGKVKASAPEDFSAFTQLESLSLSCIGLRKLVPGCFPPSLTALSLSDQSLGGSSLQNLTHLTALRHLDVAGNRFSSIDQLLLPLTSLSSLIRLDTVGCPVEDSTPDYRSKVFEMLAVLPAFNVLNGLDKLGKEVPDLDDEPVDAEGEEEEDSEEEGAEGEEEEEEEGGEAGEGEEGGDVGGAAGGDEDDDEGGEGGDEGAEDEDEGEEEEQEEEELGTAALLQEAPLEDDPEDYEEEEEEESEGEPARKRKRGAREYGDSDYEEESFDDDEDEDSDYEEED